MLHGPYEDAKAVSRANLKFYRAFESLDYDKMAAVWLRADYVKCVHPGAEMIIGYDAVMASWRSIFEHTERIRFSARDIDVRVMGNIGWITLTEYVESGFSEHERGTVVAASNLFERKGNDWFIIMHHASPMLRRVGAELPHDAMPGII
ncbi:MAG: nuclear transport factor 2 family protein [Planctomycetota bacterium]